jgi:hypothetical protein
MAPLVSTGLAWLRRQLAWSGSAQSWRERGAVAGLLVAAGLLWYYRAAFTPAQLASLAAVWALLLAALWRRGWLRLLGPVFTYEMVRAGRRRRTFFYRVAYAAALGGLVVLILLLESVNRFREPSLRSQATLANALFTVFMSAQFVAVLLLTPGYVAGAIAEEKERRTLEFMLATDLRSREIVLSNC